MRAHINGLQLETAEGQIVLVTAPVSASLIHQRCKELEKRIGEIDATLDKLTQQQRADREELRGLRGLLEEVGQTGTVVGAHPAVDAETVAP